MTTKAEITPEDYEQMYSALMKYKDNKVVGKAMDIEMELAKLPPA